MKSAVANLEKKKGRKLYRVTRGTTKMRGSSKPLEFLKRRGGKVTKGLNIIGPARPSPAQSGFHFTGKKRTTTAQQGYNLSRQEKQGNLVRKWGGGGKRASQIANGEEKFLNSERWEKKPESHFTKKKGRHPEKRVKRGGEKGGGDRLLPRSRKKVSRGGGLSDGKRCEGVQG